MTSTTVRCRPELVLLACVGLAGPAFGQASGPARLPAPKPLSDDELVRKAAEARDKAVRYLKSVQKTAAGDNWASFFTDLSHPGGNAALTLLALLEAGVKPDDEGVARGLKYLRTLEPKQTYVVALQTEVFCRVDPKAHADLIKRNVDWLEKAAVSTGGKLQGWTYAADPRNRPDNSNTEFAVAALHAAHNAGFKADRWDLWHEIADYYIRSQTKDHGWVYTTARMPHTSSPAMTAAGVAGLLHAKDVLGDDDWRIGKAAELGCGWLAREFKMGDRRDESEFYRLYALAGLGRAAGRADIGTKAKPLDWYRLGATWLIAGQKADGSWQAGRVLDSRPEIATPLALRFLASRPD